MVEALPTKIPLKIDVDVTELKIGHVDPHLRAQAPEGCTFVFPADNVVAFVAIPEKEEVVAVAAAVPGAEGVRLRWLARPVLRARRALPGRARPCRRRRRRRCPPRVRPRRGRGPGASPAKGGRRSRTPP